MARIEWGPALHLIETGIDQCVLYLDGTAVAWNGIVRVEEQDTSAMDDTLYFDGVRHRLAQSVGNFEAVVTAFTYPEEFEPYDGFDGYADGQGRPRFDLTYRTKLGDGYKIHLVYNVTANPVVYAYSTETKSPTADAMAWTLSGLAVPIPGAQGGSHIFVDTSQALPEPTAELLDILYGNDDADGRMPRPSEVVDLFEDVTELRVTYHEDGTWTAEGPDSYFEIEEDRFSVASPVAFYVYDRTYVIDSNLQEG